MKGKKAMVLILAIFLGLSIPAALSENNRLSVDYVFELVGGDEFSGCGYWTIEDTQLLNIPGAPLVPYRAARILLPQGTQLKDVRIKDGKPIVQSGFDLPWGQPPCTFSDTPVKVGRDETIYGSDDLYPNKLFDIVGVEYCKGFTILNIHLYPIQYQPKSGTVHFYEKLTVEVQTSKGTKNSLYRGLADDKADIADYVDNREMISTYEDGPVPLATEEYIIITNDTMQSTFQTLANWKAGCVNGATVYTVAWISSNYTGTDTQMKMRNFIIDKYTNNGTKYVLLGGDTAAVPYRGFYVSTGGYTDSDMLADMYFGHLDGSHNSDGDSYYGETNDGVDFGAEVAVGRAPCQTVAEAQNFVNKVIAYEQADKPKRVILHESRVQAGNNPDARCLAYGCDDYIPGDYTINYLFEESGTVTKTAWINAWAESSGSIAVAHIGHGNTDVYYINYELGGTVSWYGSDVASMTNTFWPWTTSVACISGQIEANDCLAEKYVMDANNGAIATIYNDNYGWFNTGNACMYSGEFCIAEFRACWSDGKQKLGDMLNKARSYLASSAQSNSYYRWCFYERNLVGDPESPCLTKRSCVPPPDTVTITNPANGATVSGTVNITTSTTGSIDEVRFYIDGSLKYTDTTSPFSWSWDTTAYSEGSHTIRVDGYVSGVFKDDDTVTVNVENIVDVTITNPSNGATVSGTVNITTSTTGCIDTVEFYIDGTLKHTDTASPFSYNWNTRHDPDGSYTIEAKGYCSGVYKDNDTVTCNVCNHPYVRIIDPPQPGETVSCTVTINVEASCVDTVEFYLDSTLIYTDTASPFQYIWDTCLYLDGNHTMEVKGYASGVLKDTDVAVYQVYHYYVRITSPQQGETVSGTKAITVDANCVDTVEVYIDDVLKYTESISPPHEGETFQYQWDTCLYSNGYHRIKVKGYEGGQFKRFDEITVQTLNDYIGITSPQQGESVECTYLITTDAPCISVVTAVEFYINDALLCTDENYPFECNWDTCSYPNGEYTVTAKAYAPGLLFGSAEKLVVLIDSDSITCQVYNCCIEITNPQDDAEVYGTVLITTNTWCCLYEVEFPCKVEFYIDEVLKETKIGPPFEYSWDTTDPDYAYLEDEKCDIEVIGYYYTGESKGSDTITVTVNNYDVQITYPQDGGEVSGTITITVDTRGIEMAQFCIDDLCIYTDCEPPFEYLWNTASENDGQHTIIVKGFDVIVPEICSGLSKNPLLQCKAQDEITVEVNNIYVKITDPQDGEEVSGTFLITTDTKGIDTVRFYIDDVNSPYECEDTSAPFECLWDTTKYADGDHTIIARGYASGDLQDQDTVTCSVCNGSAALCLGIFFGCAGIVVKKH